MNLLKLLDEQKNICQNEFNKRSVEIDGVWYVACEDVLKSQYPKQINNLTEEQKEDLALLYLMEQSDRNDVVNEKEVFEIINSDEKEYTRERLINICEKAFVLQKHWYNRDSASAQMKLGQVYSLLKAGCEYEIQYTDDESGCNTDESTIWIQFYVHDFGYFENGASEDSRGSTGDWQDDYHFYMPTEKRLNESKGKDWY